jgi:hypothetical protein
MVSVNAGTFCLRDAHFCCQCPSKIKHSRTIAPATANRLREVASEKHSATIDHLANEPAIA